MEGLIKFTHFEGHCTDLKDDKKIKKGFFDFESKK